MTYNALYDRDSSLVTIAGNFRDLFNVPAMQCQGGPLRTLEIHDVVYQSDGTLERLVFGFAEVCQDFILRGVVRYNSPYADVAIPPVPLQPPEPPTTPPTTPGPPPSGSPGNSGGGGGGAFDWHLLFALLSFLLVRRHAHSHDSTTST